MPLKFTVSAIGKRYAALLQRKSDQIREVSIQAMEETKDEILSRGRADISGAGSFGRRWTEGLQGEVTEAGPGEVDLNITHDVSYFMVFQKGALIRGRPLLAIPLSFAGVPKGTYARDFPGGLFKVNRKAGGAPLLLSRADRQPKYFLRESVTIPKKFRVLEIIAEESKKLRARFLALLRKA
jgi:Family of unknown function (DUF6441)